MQGNVACLSEISGTNWNVLGYIDKLVNNNHLSWLFTQAPHREEHFPCGEVCASMTEIAYWWILLVVLNSRKNCILFAIAFEWQTEGQWSTCECDESTTKLHYSWYTAYSFFRRSFLVMLFLTGHFTALFCYKLSCFSCANRGILMLTSLWTWSFTYEKQGHRQPHFYSKARELNTQL